MPGGYNIMPLERLYELYRKQECGEQVLTPLGEELKEKAMACDQLTEEIDFAVENYKDSKPNEFLNRILDATSKYRSRLYRYEI